MNNTLLIQQNREFQNELKAEITKLNQNHQTDLELTRTKNDKIILELKKAIDEAQVNKSIKQMNVLPPSIDSSEANEKIKSAINDFYKYKEILSVYLEIKPIE